MRTRNALFNAILSLLYEIIAIIFGLIVPRLIISTYGSVVNGLTATINQILQTLFLLQAGAVGASIFQMFKPVAEKDFFQMSLVLDASRRYFAKVGIVFLVLVALIAPVFSKLEANDTLQSWEILLSFLIIGLNGCTHFFWLAWLDIVFSSNQQRYYLSLASILEKIVYHILLFAVLYFKIHFIYMYLAVSVGTISKIIYLYCCYCRFYKRLLPAAPKKNTYKIKNKGYLMCNQISMQAMTSLPTILISGMYSLGLASVYAVYNMVQNMLRMFVQTLQLSISEVFGNLVVSESDNRVRDVYDLLEVVFTVLGGVLCTGAIVLFMPFIYVYTGGNSFDLDYMYPKLAVLITIYSAIYCAALPCFTLSNVLGLFKETYKQAVTSAAVGAVLSITLGRIDWVFILVGPIFYYLTSLVYRIVVIMKRVKWYSIWPFLRRCTFLFLLPACGGIVAHLQYAGGYTTSWLSFFLQAVTAGCTILLLTSGYILVFERKQIRSLWDYMKASLSVRRAI